MLLDLLSNQSVHWMDVPGDPNYGNDKGLNTAMAGANQHLIDLVHALYSGASVPFHTLMTRIERASQSITGSIPQDPSLAILIGRPIAVVQAVVELELLGTPAVNQKWEAFDKDKHNWDAIDVDNGNNEKKLKTLTTGRVNGGVAGVQFEVELGSLGRFRDGLLGFFVGHDQGYDFSNFYTPASDTPCAGGAAAARDDHRRRRPHPTADAGGSAVSDSCGLGHSAHRGPDDSTRSDRPVPAPVGRDVPGAPGALRQCGFRSAPADRDRLWLELAPARRQPMDRHAALAHTVPCSRPLHAAANLQRLAEADPSEPGNLRSKPRSV